MSRNKFICCPQCGSDKIQKTDYEIEDGVVDEDGRLCEDCGWEGDVTELVQREPER